MPKKNQIALLFLLLTNLFLMSLSHAGEIIGYEFNDLNQNSVDNNEPRMSRIQINLKSTSGNRPSLSTFTNQNGQFSFKNLPSGTYQICSTLPPAEGDLFWIFTTEGCFRVRLNGKNSKAFVVFGIFLDPPTGETTGGTTGDTTGGTTGETTGGTTGETTGGTTGETTGGTTGETTGGTTGETTGGTTGGNEDPNCTYTQGYWGSSPQGQQRLIILVGSSGLNLGNRVYSAAELDNIFDAPAGGNALVSLAHQLIASKLNIKQGANSSVIVNDVNSADQLIGNLIIPPIGSDVVRNNSELGQRMNPVQTNLDNFNNGLLNVPHCTK